MKFGKHVENSYSKLHATGLTPFSYKSFKKMIKRFESEARCGEPNVRDTFMARLRDEAKSIDTQWAAAAHCVILASRSPSAMASYLNKRGMSWCLETATAAHKLQIWALNTHTCVNKLLKKYNKRCGNMHGVCDALPCRFCFSSGETIARIDGLTRRCAPPVQ